LFKKPTLVASAATPISVNMIIGCINLKTIWCIKRLEKLWIQLGNKMDVF